MTADPIDVVIVDSGGANLASLQFALERLGARSAVSTDCEVIGRAPRVLLPGVGSAQDAMARLRATGLDRVLPGLRQPVLGICLGMQLLYRRSEEGDTPCLGILPATVHRLEPASGRPVPHMGWNEVRQCGPHPMWDGIPDGERFYFVHSYFVVPAEASLTAAETDYGVRFTSAVARANIFAAQFHPEKSAAAGLRLLANFIRWQP